MKKPNAPIFHYDVAFELTLDVKYGGTEDYLKRADEEQLNKLYKASKQLSDLCWQEIKRRKEQS